MSDNLRMTERIMEAVGHLKSAKCLLIMEGVFENLEQLEAWSPAHYTQKLEREVAEKTSEVARLRELLNRAIEIAKEYQKHARENINEDCDWSMHSTYKKFAEFQNAITQIATAPEEAVTEKNTKVSVKEPAPEYRELGPDEVIQAGDECKWKDDWGKCEKSVGDLARNWMPDLHFRTRRPLPVQENTPRTDSVLNSTSDLVSFSYKIERELNSTNDRMVELKHKQSSIIAAVNFCLTEYPSDRASVYLAPIMEELFSK